MLSAEQTAVLNVFKSKDQNIPTIAAAGRPLRFLHVPQEEQVESHGMHGKKGERNAYPRVSLPK